MQSQRLNTVSSSPDASTARFPIAHHGRIGFIDSNGKEVINAQFDEAQPFAEGLGAVRKGKRWGFVDPSGRLAISYQFDQATQFKSGLCPVKLNGKWGFIDSTGKLVINPQFKAATPFSEDLAGVELAGRWGFIDKSGKLTINPQFEFQTPASENNSSLTFNDGLCALPETPNDGGDDNIRFGYVDHTGKWAISPQFDAADDFGQDLAPVESGDRWGYINKTGTFVINPQFDWACPFAWDRGLVKLGDRFGYIDRDGKYAVNPQYDSADSFTEGLAAVQQGNRWGYIGPDGKYAVNPQFDQAFPFQNGLAVVRLNKQFGYINKTGKFVWGPEPVASLYRVEAPPKRPAAASKRSVRAAATTPRSGAVSHELMPASQWRLLTEVDLADKSAWQLTLIRNEIFARHGLIFKRNDLQSYFNQQSWYRPISSDANAVQSRLNSFEARNAVFVRNYAAARGLL